MSEIKKTQENVKLVREMARETVMVSLSTLTAENSHPFTSSLAMATKSNGTPVFMCSQLSKHTHNFQKNPSASILVQQYNTLSSNQDFARASIMGEIRILEDKEAQKRYLRRYPETRQYLDFGDFQFYDLDIKNIYLVGGFARIGDISPEDYFCKPLTPELEQDACSHMNQDHKEALTHYGSTYLGVESEEWAIVGIDCEGFDMKLEDKIYRINFPKTVTNSAQLRKIFTDM